MIAKAFLLLFVASSFADQSGDADVSEVTAQGLDMILTPGQEAAMKSRTMVENWVKLWPQGQVPYVLDKTLGQGQIDKLMQAFAAYKNKTCIRFVQRTNQPNYIWYTGGFGFNCYSNLGMTGGAQRLSFTNDCPVGTAIHESAHALGFMHEHMRSDRDSYITIDFNKISADWKSQYKMVPYSAVNPKSARTKYDYTSVMHYGSGGVITTRDPKAQNLIGQRVGFGKCDASKINNMYDCKGFERLPECFT